MALFDSYLMVDWSAASTPVTGKDSIWWGYRRGDTFRTGNPSTRTEAMSEILALITAEIEAGRRVLAGFDFAFGYPAGFAKATTGKPGWQAVWTMLHDRITDDTRNRNNRFAVADALNTCFPAPGPFWAALPKGARTALPRTRAYDYTRPASHRAAERCARTQGARPFPVWQISGPGTVGGQALTGIAWLEWLRRRLGEAVAVWPFEGGLGVPRTPVVLAEIYPSLWPVDPHDGETRDAAQVRTVTERLAAHDSAGTLAPLFAGPQDPALHPAIEQEEAWILGLAPQPTAAPRQAYERNPAEIYRQSFAIVRDEARLDHMPPALHDVAIRLVHACGMPDITARLAWSPDVADRAATALGAGAPILCDCEAVASMITRARLPRRNEVICTLNNPETRARAATIANTRSAAAVDLWREHIEGAVVAIGNAPTALFHLLDLIDAGWPRPAAILAFPVGFVGAAESKAALAANPRGAPFLTLRGRRGGSAMAAAAVNALAAGLTPPP